MRHELKDLRVTVMGLGLNQGGLGVSKWLLAQGARLTVTDLKDRHALSVPIAELETFRKTLGRKAWPIRYVLGEHRAADFRDAGMVIQNPDVRRDSRFLKIARKAGVPIESDISLFFELCAHPIVGVSGTKGKTTVSTLLGAMLQASFGKAFVAGNIRTSPLGSFPPETDPRQAGVMNSKKQVPIVLELSSWQLESLAHAKRSPAIAVLTNVLPDHLNRYDGMKDYAAAKELIYAWQLPTDIAIVPLDNPFTKKMGTRVRAERFWASMRAVPDEQNGLYYKGSKAILRAQGIETILFDKGDVRMPGAHNAWNALLAAGAASLRGAKPEAIGKALRAFKGVPHRLELVSVLRGVGYWNDTAATTPEASVAAMETIFAKKKGVLIAGGADKALKFDAWAKAVKRHAKEIVLFEGTATPKMAAALKQAGMKIGETVLSMQGAVAHASRAARKGEAVLLSPGCASFGVFINEFDRGDQFRSEVKKLA